MSKHDSELTPTNKRVLKLTWAFYWRWVLVGMFVLGLDALRQRYVPYPISDGSLLYIFALTHAGIFFGIFGFFLAGKKIGDFRLALIS